MMLLLLNDVITKFTEYYGLTLGVVILLFALVFRKGVTDFALEALRRRFGENRA
jgi:branched-chain amino acid transport system permease protein